jgi:two-component system, cell cycle sensor histidine kinase and response regulator CckA
MSKKDQKMRTSNDKMIRGNITHPSNTVEDALMDSELRYRRLFETAQDGILIIDADTGHIIDVNPFLVNLLGYSREDFIDKTLWRFSPFKDIRASKSAFQTLKNNNYIRYEHLPLEAKDGRRVAVEFISNVYKTGRKRTIQCNIRDISQRRQTEKSHLKLETELKQVQKMEAVATLAGGMAHQFNNALTVISGGLSLLEHRYPQDIDAFLQSMNEAADKMARLTRQLLAYARGGKHYAETLWLSDLVTDSLRSFTPADPATVHETEFSSDLPPIKADRNQMQMALLAVLANASEAIETQRPGLIRITCRKQVLTAEGVKAFSGLRPGSYACLTVEDNGKGMKEDTRNRVFEPFFTTRFPGRGLGMAAVYGVVKNHNGWISVESQWGAGTTVTVWLPAVLEFDAKMEKIGIDQNERTSVPDVDENKACVELK